jgi:hypothetical protein
MVNPLLRSGASWFSILAAQGIVCAAAADPITVTETIPLGQTLTAGGATFNGAFNIDSLLPATGYYAAPLNILSAVVALYGYSSPQTTSTLNSYSYASNGTGQYFQYTVTYWQGNSNGVYYYNCYWGCYSYAYSYSYTGTGTVYDNVSTDNITAQDSTVDTASITAGTTSLTGSDSVTSAYAGGYGYYQGSYYGGGYYYSGYNYNYGIPYSSSEGSTYEDVNFDNYNTTDSGYFGALQATGSLDAVSIAELSQGGILDFSVSAANGQFTPSDVTITVTLDQSVPEPGALSIFGFSLLLLALRARQIRRLDKIQ